MLIAEMTLPSKDLDKQAVYYADVLGLPVRRAMEKVLIQGGESRLQFQQAAASWDAHFHFAFEVPNNRFEQAKDWLQRRATLLKDQSGRDTFRHTGWKADSVYFKDPAGNVLEFIAREQADTASGEEFFRPENILRISEFGIAAEDVPALVGDISRKTGLQVYGEASPNFTAVGDLGGLLIVVERDRIWYPNSGVPAEYTPFEVFIETGGQHYRLSAPDYPAEIHASAGTVG